MYNHGYYKQEISKKKKRPPPPRVRSREREDKGCERKKGMWEGVLRQPKKNERETKRTEKGFRLSSNKLKNEREKGLFASRSIAQVSEKI